jgi:hypothetical protein
VLDFDDVASTLFGVANMFSVIIFLSVVRMSLVWVFGCVLFVAAGDKGDESDEGDVCCVLEWSGNDLYYLCLYSSTVQYMLGENMHWKRWDRRGLVVSQYCRVTIRRAFLCENE